MKTLIASALTWALLAGSPALAGNAHMDREAAEVLRNYNINMSVADLSEHQKGQIVLLAHMGDGGGKRARILSILGQGLVSRWLRN